MILYEFYKKQVRIHESTVACDWAGAVMPENHEKSEVISDRQTDGHSELQSRAHATKNGTRRPKMNSATERPKIESGTGRPEIRFGSLDEY